MAKAGWREAWLTFMRELAPQSKDGGYTRPTYTFQNQIGERDFPAEPGRYVVYLGELLAQRRTHVLGGTLYHSLYSRFD